MEKDSLKNLLKFDGQWRRYQKRVLDRADKHLKDKRIHIVAAPGSGKTTLGIELIRRLDEPALVLSPSINIRNQWIQRIASSFLAQGMDTAGILSNSMKEPALITAITYQALHSCMTKGEDYSTFDFFQVMKQAGIKTLCLDEAHHLRSEWWKALEKLVEESAEMTIISLTATPPYDASKGEWERYIGLCGPIDEEIIVPELVKEKSLCPHQDYVYFNMPTEEEAQAVIRFRNDAAAIGGQIYEEEAFIQAVSTHAGLSNPEQYTDQFLEKKEYLAALIVFLNAKQIPFSEKLKGLLGKSEKLPCMNLQQLEIVLQGFLYDDTESFQVNELYREKMIALLKGHGLIHKNRVTFTVNEEVNKLLTMSKGKIRSIVKLVGAEYENLGEELRLLILTDYIKKEYMFALGDGEKSVNELGVVPIFENIRREYVGINGSVNRVTDEKLRLAALSGSIVIIPHAAREALEAIVQEREIQCAIKECGIDNYYQVAVSGTEETASGLVTELFNQGAIRVLIGTKSLLGEGWDSPCINSLILASFVGSYMLSNQMRGRAIRTMKGNPDKVSNIWHLICMEPEQKQEDNILAIQEESDDFATMKRRFEGFLGVHYEEDIIENGLERLTFIKPPYTRENVELINQQMLEMAAKRDALRTRWEEVLAGLDKMEATIEVGANMAYYKPFIALLPAGPEKFLGNRLLYSLGKSVLCALKKMDGISDKRVKVGVEKSKENLCYIYLQGGTERDKDVFAQCMYELLGEVEDNRYLLKAVKKLPWVYKYYCVPALFDKKKENAEFFYGMLRKKIGSYDLLYTRSEPGRKELLAARIYALAHREEYCLKKRKRVKSGK
uniref:DEAD/DEAH box helicase family protein n=1 Tax=Acetatifactor sp. TaxID=1872090 RepID=UPI004057018A